MAHAPPSTRPESTRDRAAGLAVHLFTASGAGLALMALLAAIERDFAATFAWLGLALVVDGVDGTLARAARVETTAPWLDGAILDFVVDFLTYVLVPVVALVRSNLLPTGWSLAMALVVVVASAIYFADVRMKTADHWFRGFPALWNVLIFHLFVLRPPAIVSAALMLVACVAMFAPVAFVHPMRMGRGRWAALAATGAWAACAIFALHDGLAPGGAVRAGLLAAALALLAMPLMRRSFHT